LKRVLIVALFLISLVTGSCSAFAAPLFSQANKQAVILLPLEEWMSTWNRNTYVSLLERAGYSVDVLTDGNVSISFLRTGLARYDIIILRTDSFQYEGMDYFCSGEPFTYGARHTYSAEISSQEVSVGACVGFSTLFLRDNYPANSLRHGLVFVIGSDSGVLASSFLASGAAAFIGYFETFSLSWGRMDVFSEKLLSYLASGSSVSDSVLQLTIYVHLGHGGTANWPSVYWTGDGTYKI